MSLSPLTVEDFTAFFQELWGRDCSPFPWQKDFARRLCLGAVPDYVAVPTGSGKTACIDAAVFALAVQAALPVAQRTQGRRIFFIVNRRVIVDEAYDRAGVLCQKLREASSDSIAGRVAASLRQLAGASDTVPLERVQLRGGIYRDRGWAGSLLQPMVICSTVDQVGSRLLFRGYGVRPQARPIHAALVAHDSLLIVDEAHISRPFIQTLEWVKRYRLHQPAGSETVHLPFDLIQMTATPPANVAEGQKVSLTNADREHAVLEPRLRRAKPARLAVEPKAKGKAREEAMAKRLAEEAESMLAKDRPDSIAIMVNRVATARSVYEKLLKKFPGRVTLLIGRLRPLDRESATREIQNRLKTGSASRASAMEPLIVVSTQCLEVGADLDFDALITEAASLDSLRQRFGRLNRGGRDIPARAVVVLPGDQDLPTDKLDEAALADPIYGNAIPRTWRWLGSLAQDGVVDFGINAMTSAVESLLAGAGEDALAAMLSPKADAPVLLPAYLDCWVQTNPSPAADPDIALFLHGPQREMAEVQVCWRGDLPETQSEDEWADVLSLCPPATAECLPVPLHIFREWLSSRGEYKDFSSDTVEILAPPERKAKEEPRAIDALIWRGPDDRLFARRAGDLRPGDTIILRTQDGGWSTLGHVPNQPAEPLAGAGSSLNHQELGRIDLAERAMADTKRRAVLRIHRALWPNPEDNTAAAELWDMAFYQEEDWSTPEIKALLYRLVNDEAPGWPLSEEQRRIVSHLAHKDVRLSPPEPYPDQQGFVLSSRDLLSPAGEDPANGGGDTDAEGLLEAAQPQELCSHTRDVLSEVEHTLSLLPPAAWRESLLAAAAAHDWGKIDPRFQALLRSTTVFAAMASEVHLAKSGSLPTSAAARRAARARAGLPEGFRHEMLSLQMAQSEVGSSALPSDQMQHSLALHLIATHHGYGRPFAPFVEDEAPFDISLPMRGNTIAVTVAERLAQPAHALDSGITERFWQVNRHYGWWGLSLLETILRLADQTASAGLQVVVKT